MSELEGLFAFLAVDLLYVHPQRIGCRGMERLSEQERDLRDLELND